MPTESELRDTLRDAGDPSTRIDVDAVLRRARSRRRPRIALAGALSGLAAAALVTPVVLTGLPSLSAGDGAGSGADEASPESQTLAEPDEAQEGTEPAGPLALLNRCATAVTATEPDGALRLSLVDVVGEAGSDRIPTEVVLVNAGAERFRGVVSAPPMLTVAEEGVVVARTAPTADARAFEIDLQPGESLAVPASLEPVRCSAEGDDGAAEGDDAAGTSERQTDAAPLEPGVYELSAAVEIVGADDVRRVVGGDPVRVRLQGAG